MRVRRTLAALLAAPFLLSACGGGSSSAADPPVSSPPTSSDPTTEPPAHESPEHFIRRWLAVGTRMQNTGMTDEYLSMTQGCRDCRAVAARVTRVYAAGGYYKTRGVRAAHVSQAKGHTFDLVATFFPTTYATSSGGSTEHFDGGEERFQVGLVHSGTSWRVTSFVQVSS
jgi:hypothetical protein